jgi:hypothetical protein
MNNIIKNQLFTVAVFTALFITGCSDDDNTMIPQPMINGETSVDLEDVITLEADGSYGAGATYLWEVTDPDGTMVSLTDAGAESISFIASKTGSYNVTVAVTTGDGSANNATMVMVVNPTYATIDQMGRPAINTVFNFFGDADAKNGYNLTTPEGGNADPASFEFILDNLQEYIGLDSDSYTNVLGLDNGTTASVLTVDVLMSNKDFPSTYGPSDLNNLSLGENVLNGRGLNNDVVDVTLILAFAGNDLGNLNNTQLGLISDNVDGNDRPFSDTFPYLATPN